MTPKETRQVTTHQLRSVNRDERTVDIIASTFDLDSYGTRIDPNGWDTEQFRKNPVICLQHDDRGYTETNGLPIANAIPQTIRVEGGKLLMQLRFPAKGTFPTADIVFDLIADGFLRGVSVGFEPTEWEDVEEEENGYKKSVRIYKKSKLVEVSIVTLPSNDAAMVQRAKEMNADPEAIKKRTEELEKRLQEERIDFEEFRKYKRYFEQKQPANKESTKVLKSFFVKILKVEQPADEVQAWQRMAEAIEAMEEKPVETTAEEKKEEPMPEEKPETPPETPEEQKEETTPTPTPEAPEPERKASVHIPISALRELPRILTESMQNMAAEALRQGLPRSDLPGFLDSLEKKLRESFSHPRI